jgi:hypothetical protein
LVAGDDVHRRVSVDLDGAQHVGRDLLTGWDIAHRLNDRFGRIECGVDVEIPADGDRGERHPGRDAAATTRRRRESSTERSGAAGSSVGSSVHAASPVKSACPI